MAVDGTCNIDHFQDFIVLFDGAYRVKGQLEVYPIVKYILANSCTVLCPFSASHATRALNSALERLRCVILCPLLTPLVSTQQSIFMGCPNWGVHYRNQL